MTRSSPFTIVASTRELWNTLASLTNTESSCFVVYDQTAFSVIYHIIFRCSERVFGDTQWVPNVWWARTNQQIRIEFHSEKWIRKPPLMSCVDLLSFFYYYWNKNLINDYSTILINTSNQFQFVSLPLLLLLTSLFFWWPFFIFHFFFSPFCGCHCCQKQNVLFIFRCGALKALPWLARTFGCHPLLLLCVCIFCFI